VSEQLDATKRMLRAHKARHAQAVVDETALISDLVAITKLEDQVAGQESYERLRDLTVEAPPARPPARSKRRRRSAKAD
jgi:hypothetical protein